MVSHNGSETETSNSTLTAFPCLGDNRETHFQNGLWALLASETSELVIINRQCDDVRNGIKVFFASFLVVDVAKSCNSVASWGKPSWPSQPLSCCKFQCLSQFNSPVPRLCNAKCERRRKKKKAKCRVQSRPTHDKRLNIVCKLKKFLASHLKSRSSGSIVYCLQSTSWLFTASTAYCYVAAAAIMHVLI